MCNKHQNEFGSNKKRTVDVTGELSLLLFALSGLAPLSDPRIITEIFTILNFEFVQQMASRYSDTLLEYGGFRCIW